MFNLYHLFTQIFYYTQVVGENGGDDGGDDGDNDGDDGSNDSDDNGGGATNLKAFGLVSVLCVATITSSFWVITYVAT